MRLIDADKLKETISKYEFNAPNERYKQGGECVLNFYMPKIIDDAPTIEAEPVRHGGWAYNDMYLPNCAECSECGWKSSVSGDEISSYHYCPNCGARMEELEERLEQEDRK